MSKQGEQDKTIFECCVEGKDVNKTLHCIYHANSEVEAIKYLEENGGGIYRNTLHKFQVRVLFV